MEAPWEKHSLRKDTLRRNIAVLASTYAASPVLLYVVLQFVMPGHGDLIIPLIALILGLPFGANLLLFAVVLVRMSDGQSAVPGRILLPCLLVISPIEAILLYRLFVGLARSIP